MPKHETLRVAAGTPDAPRSAVWRLAINKEDIYISTSGGPLTAIKISLHKSGKWILAGTTESGVAFDGNRRAKQWERPLEHTEGITRGPSILVPSTVLGSRPPVPEKERAKGISWFPGAADGHFVDLSLYIVGAGARAEWSADQTQLAQANMANGAQLVFFGSVHATPPAFKARIEQVLSESVFHADKPEDACGSLLWFTEVQDTRKELTIPCFVDLPLPIVQTGSVVLKT